MIKAILIILIVLVALFVLTFIAYITNADCKLVEKIYDSQIKYQDERNVEEKL